MNNNAKNPIMYNSEEYYKVVRDYKGLTELRGGDIVYLASPNKIHQDIKFGMERKFIDYIDKNKGKCKVMISPFDVKLDDYNIVTPDIFIAMNPDEFDERKYIGIPDFAAEILSDNRTDDLCYKLELYQEFGIREYWIVDPKYKKVLVYFFEDPDFLKIYNFDENIPVNIYKSNETQLELNIAELL